MSDSHPETLTDPEHSDHAGVASSPPQSGDEVRAREKSGKETERRSKLFNKTPGGHQVLERFNQTIKTRHSLVGDKKDNSFKVGLVIRHPYYHIIQSSEWRYFEV